MLTRSRPSQVSVCLNTPRKHSQLIMSHTAAFRCQTPCRLSTRGRRIVGLCFAGLVTKVNSEELQKALDMRQKPMVLDFYANWCGPCLLLAKELEKVAEHFGDGIQILKIDTDENPDLSSQLRIEGLPTMVFVSSDVSKPAIRTEGLLPAETIIKIITDELTALPDVPAAAGQS